MLFAVTRSYCATETNKGIQMFNSYTAGKSVKNEPNAGGSCPDIPRASRVPENLHSWVRFYTMASGF